MKALDQIFESARKNPRSVILSEGNDTRVRVAAAKIKELGLANLLLLADSPCSDFDWIAPADADDLPALADEWHKLRAAKGMTYARATEEMRDPLRQAAMRVRLGQAHGTVGGAAYTTSEVVRAALQIIGRSQQSAIVSSFFLMLSQRDDKRCSEGMIFADCGLVIEPNAEELAAIAIAAAENCRKLLGQAPRVAFLSFSTAQSANHPSLERIRKALDLVHAMAPDIEADGEMQFDAAFDDEIRARKAPGSALSGKPNVFIFPDLNAGNIGYKIAQKLGGLSAIGPILQGLEKPANDLSRGCSIDEIVAAVAVTAVQAVNYTDTGTLS